MEASAVHASTQVNGTTTPSQAEDEELYTQLLRLRDVVIAGKHASLKLPTSAIDQLKATLNAPDAHAIHDVLPHLNGIANHSAFATNHTDLSQSYSLPSQARLPGLQPSSAAPNNGSAQAYTKPASAAGLDPIFLQKSDSLVRAEGQLKRQRLDRDLQAQVDQRKHSSRDKDAGAEAPSPIDIDLVLLNAQERVKPVSGLKPVAGSAEGSSFDENDYYSSQVQSAWSSEIGSSKGSDKAAGAFTADFERLDGAAQAPNPRAKRSTIAGSSYPSSAKDRPHVYTNEPEGVYNIEDEDDDYTPPDATAFDVFRPNGSPMMLRRHTPPDDDNSDYEPGEITQESSIPTAYHQQPAHPSPRVPVIRNHLTHIAAPQPNRVSPLATAKGPSIELELVNGRPEIVQKPQRHSNQFHSRASTASPSGNNGVSGSGKKRRNKKRKRDNEPTGRSKKRRERNNAVVSPAYPPYQEPYIKDEPVSPPSFANMPEAPPYGQQQPQQHRTAAIDLVSPRHAPQPPYVHHANEPPRSGLRYEYAQPSEPTMVRIASPSIHRPVQRDNQDLRRVASLHQARQPASPARAAISPVGPYRTVSMTYGDQRLPQPVQLNEEDSRAQYQEPVHYAPDKRSRSPPRLQQYSDPYVGRAPSPALMPPPPPAAPPPRRIIVDQYGNRYYAAEPAPAPATVSAPRASVVPVERRDQPEVVYERAPSRASAAYAQPPVLSTPYEPDRNRTVEASSSGPYEQVVSRMAPPPPPSRRVPPPEQRVEYIDANGYRVREYSSRPVEQVRYAEAPTSPVYQEVRGYEQVPPSQGPPAAEPTSPVYAPTRSYSTRPEEFQQVPHGYIRQASVAPQYGRPEPPPPQMRALSVMPSTDYGTPGQPQPIYAQAPQAITRYVDQYGNEVFPREVRQAGEFR